MECKFKVGDLVERIKLDNGKQMLVGWRGRAAIDFVDGMMNEMTSREIESGDEYTYTPFVLNQPFGYNYPTSKGE